MRTDSADGPSTARVASLLVRFAIRRSINRIVARIRQRTWSARRQATARKKSGGGTILVFFSVVFLFNGFTMAARLVHHLAAFAEETRGDAEVVEPRTVAAVRAAQRDRARAALGCHGEPEDPSEASPNGCDGEWEEKLEKDLYHEADMERTASDDRTARVRKLMTVFEARGASGFRERRVPRDPFLPSTSLWLDSSDMLSALGLISWLLVANVIALGIVGDQDLAKVDWKLEWFFTFPVPVRALVLARIAEIGVASPFQWFVLFPFFGSVFWCAGHGWSGLLMGAAATLSVGVVAGSVRVVMEAGLRRFVSLRTVARVQAGLWVVAFPPFCCAVAASSSPDWARTLARFARRWPGWVWVNPATPIGMAGGGWHAWAAACGTVLCPLAAAGLATGLTSWMIRDGITTSGGPHQGTHRRAKRLERSAAAGRWTLGAVARKEAMMLLRDRSMFAQVFVVPVVAIGMQFVVNRSLYHGLQTNPRHAAALVFASASVVLATGACNTFAVETQAMWLYYTVPRRIEKVFIDKALFWSGVASLVAVLLFGALEVSSGTFGARTWPSALLAVAGIAIYAFVATGIGVLGTDPLETEPRRRIKLVFVYLFFFLSATFVFAIYTPSAWAKVTQVALSGLLAFALWQKVADRVPFFLDPGASPPPNIAVADGVIAVMAFFVLQGLLGWMFSALDFSPGAALLFAFSGAGVTVGAVALLVFWRSGMPDLAATLGMVARSGRAARGVLFGVLGGAAAAAVAHAYLWVVDRVAVLREVRDETTALSPDDRGPSMIPWIVVIGVLAAPIFEEFLFRGVLYGGFRRSLAPARAALASALVFGIVHPAIACLPVFFMGFIAALVYERSRFLPAAIATHMAYNALVLLPGLWRG